MDRGRDGGDHLTLQQRTNIRLAATHTIHQGVAIVTDAYRAAGQTAISQPSLRTAVARCVVGLAAGAGPSTHYMTIGRHLLGLPPDTMMFL